ncbi:RNA polymerase sigma factor [Jidongwangia harbinensis]|uniref:RNA polymerase sigma factor n=1 Tax=Jidongwangia harbinensis TaxID=2878561 RepID=UPI001CD99187|nr:sigma-70 family RNA polymerase sigma factor [Jidongwangia harbinensis]MCA2219240.1 sigma-70 family RNA polymerase sigma factor [Jidongwangia harbinensis]
MRDDPEVIAMVTAARDGDVQAWNRLVDRYAPLVWSICKGYRLSPSDAEDVGQNVWLRLVEQLPRIRVPAALAGWLMTTTRRECLRVLRVTQRVTPADTVAERADEVTVQHDIDEAILAYERKVALREAFAQLSPRCQHMLSLLMQDPPVPYGVISVRLGMPQGSVGPIRARCLERLRNCPALVALIEAGADNTGGGGTGDR